MKVLLGNFEQERGTVETSPHGLIYAGRDPEHVRWLVEQYREWRDHTGVFHTLTDEEVVRSLPYRMQGWLWAVCIDEHGNTQDQPPFDPWGEIWYTPPGL